MENMKILVLFYKLMCRNRYLKNFDNVDDVENVESVVGIGSV